MAGELEVMVDGLAFPECPRWHDGALWLSEKRAGRVVRLSPAGAVEAVVEVEGGPGGLGWTPDDELLVVDARRQRLLRFDGVVLHEVADLTAVTVGRCNDMIVDALGRAYVGHFGYDLLGGAPPAPATLVLVDADGSLRVVADELSFPNGCAFTPDGATLIVAESGAARLTSFRVLADGSLTDRRLFADLAPIVPDGIAMDAEGGVWVSDPIGCQLVRVTADGHVGDPISTAPLGAFACELGGDDGRTLYVCLYTEEASQQADGAPPVGQVAALRVDIPRAD